MTDMTPRTEAAANLHDETFCDKRATKAYWQSDAIRALTPDDARAALEAMLAEAEKRGMLRAAEIARTTPGQGMLLRADICDAIRAEAEE